MSAGIELYLEGILETTGVVSIPGVGTFRQQAHPARLDETGSQMLPPQVEVRYSPQVVPEWRLESQLVKGLQVSEAEARELATRITALLRRQLRQKGRYQWPGVGTLFREGDSSYRFEAVSAPLNTLAGGYFGLRPVRSPDLPATSLSLSQAETQNAMKQPGASTPKRARGIGWKSLLLLLLLPTLGLGLVEYGPFHKQRASVEMGVKKRLPAPPPTPQDMLADDQSEPVPALQEESRTYDPFAEAAPATPDEAPADPTASVDTPPATASYAETNRSIAQAEGTTRSMDGANARQSRPDSVAPTNLADLDPRAAKPEKTYYLVVSSFKARASAVKAAQNLEAKGYTPRIIPPEMGNSPNYRVTIFQSPDREQVRRVAEKRQREGASSGWILALP
mgnify:CR=1 FL=1